jgi:hypothetical protein
MRSIRIVLIPVLAVVMAVVAGSAVYAATSTSGTAKFSVPVSVSIAQGPGGTCPAGACDFGSPALGIASAGQTEDVSLNSNDSVGFSLTGSSVQASWVESGAGCTPNAAHNVSAGVVLQTAAAVTGGTGTGGTPAALISIGTAAQPLYSTNPTMTGSGMDALITLKINAPPTTPANGASCAYVIGYTISIVAL